MAPRTRPQPPTATIASELKAFLGDLRDRRGLASNTIASYCYDLQTAARILTEPLVAITTHQVEAFLTSRQDRPSTTNRRIASLSRFFTWAIKHELCDRSPMLFVDTKQDDVRLPRPIPLADLPALDAAITEAAAPYRLIFTLLRETGLRADEVLQLNVGDVVLYQSAFWHTILYRALLRCTCLQSYTRERGLVLEPSREALRIREAKNNVERMAVLNADVMKHSLRLLRASLRAFGSVSSSMPLFRSKRGTRIPYDTLYYQ